jgi:hypothetical protein
MKQLHDQAVVNNQGEREQVDDTHFNKRYELKDYKNSHIVTKPMLINRKPQLSKKQQ